MRNFFLSCSLLAFLTISVQAQDGDLNIIKINPLGALVGAAHISYERALNARSSFLLSPSFGYFKMDKFKYSIMGIGTEYRFYLLSSKEAPIGFYAGPGIGYTFGKVKLSLPIDAHPVEKINVSGFAAKGILGYQWIWESRLSLDINGGVQYFGLNVKNKSGEDQNFIPFKGFLPALGFSLGYAF